MTDRELLELAAKAAGIKYHSYVDHELYGRGINIGEVDVPLWNPLTDDGDALRLAVKLKIGNDCFVDGDRLENCCAWCNHRDVRGFHRHYEPYRDDPMEATRRAIVIVAAKIGENLV